MINPQITNLSKMIEIYREFYITRDDTYSKQKGEDYSRQKEPLTDEILMQHLQGNKTIGFYVLGKDNKAKFMDLDFDNKKNPQLSYPLALKAYEELSKNFPNSVIASFSGRKGYHVDLFVEPTEAWNIRRFYKPENKARLGYNELSPKQDFLTDEKPIGNLIKHAPCLHQVTKKWSLFWNMRENRAMTEQEVFYFFDNCEKIKLKNYPKPKEQQTIISYSQPIMISSLAVKKYPLCIQNILSRDLQDGRHRTLMLLCAFFYRIGFNKKEIKNILHYKHFGCLLEGFEPNSNVQDVLNSIQPIGNTSLEGNFDKVFEHEYSNVIEGKFGIPNCDKIRDKIGGYFGGEFGLADINVCDKACKLYRSIKKYE